MVILLDISAGAEAALVTVTQQYISLSFQCRQLSVRGQFVTLFDRKYIRVMQTVRVPVMNRLSMQ